ncbi:MAG: methylenetetrahydrofolate reductase [Victivallaceae bacterium]
MQKTIVRNYRVECSPPRQKVERLKERLEKFSLRFNLAEAHNLGTCITDNAMGHLAFQGTELLTELKLPAKRTMIHLNTFHSLNDLHWILDNCLALEVKELLIISGDGSPRLPRLKPSEIGSDKAAVTSVELVAYIVKFYPGKFKIGVAFNQYEPHDHELLKLKQKIDVGAEFIITQPVLGSHPEIDAILEWLTIPVIIEVWMSPKLELLKDCIGYNPTANLTKPFNPIECLNETERNYPDCNLYLALLDFDKQLPLLNSGVTQS